MNCNVIKDLLPLYIDGCCSVESADIVKEHIEKCPECKKLYEEMKAPSDFAQSAPAPVKLGRINERKASVLQSVLLFVFFALIAIGVSLEAATPSGHMNGFWAVTLTVPATGFMLSLTNWYFVRLYKSRKIFSNCSLFATLGITAVAYVWSGLHYKFGTFDFQFIGNAGFISLLQSPICFFGIGILLTAVLCVLSKVLSNRYAAMLGKE